MVKGGMMLIQLDKYLTIENGVWESEPNNGNGQFNVFRLGKH